VGLWSAAIEQGAFAGRVLAGEPVVYEGQPQLTQLKVLDHPVFSLGKSTPMKAKTSLNASTARVFFESCYLEVL